MNFEQIEPISHPIQRVYEALRDQTPELGAYLPQITSITEIEREPEVDGITRVVCKWQANDKSAPAAVRPFLSPKMLSWLDHAQWVDGEHLVHWRTLQEMDEYEIRGRSYPDVCTRCAGKSQCAGLRVEYVEAHGERGLIPFDKPPQSERPEYIAD